MLRLNNIIKSAKNRRILTDINVEFEDKGLYLIKGESGSGKSTLLNIIAGIDSDYKGKIEVDGKRLKRNPSSYRKNYVSFMSNDYDLIDNLTIKENFDLLQEMYGFKSDEVDVILKSFKLDINLNQKISELSGGQRQRVMVAKTLILKKPICIFDEPTANLDESNKNIIWECLRAEAKERLIIVSTHDDVKSDHEYIIEYGKINNQCSFEVKNTFVYKNNRNIRITRRAFNFKFNILSMAIFIMNLFLLGSFVVSTIKFNSLDINIYDKDEYFVINYNTSGTAFMEKVIKAYDDGIIASVHKDMGSYEFSGIFRYEKNSIETYSYNKKTKISNYAFCKDYDLILGQYETNNFIIGKKLADELIKTCHNELTYNDLIGRSIFAGNICGISSKNTMCAYLCEDTYTEKAFNSYSFIATEGCTDFEDYTVVYGKDVDAEYHTKIIDGEEVEFEQILINAAYYEDFTYEEICNRFPNTCVGIFVSDSATKKEFKYLSKKRLNFSERQINFEQYPNDLNIVSGRLPQASNEVVLNCYLGKSDNSKSYLNKSYNIGDQILGYTVVGLYNSDDKYCTNAYVSNEGLKRYEDISCVLYARYNNGMMSARKNELTYEVKDVDAFKELFGDGYYADTFYNVDILGSKKDIENTFGECAIVLIPALFITLLIISINSIIGAINDKKNIGVLLADGNRKTNVIATYICNTKIKPLIINLITIHIITILYLIIQFKYNILSLGYLYIYVLLLLFAIILFELFVSLIPALILVNKNIIKLLKSGKNTTES